MNIHTPYTRQHHPAPVPPTAHHPALPTHALYAGTLRGTTAAYLKPAGIGQTERYRVEIVTLMPAQTLIRWASRHEWVDTARLTDFKAPEAEFTTYHSEPMHA